MIRPPHTTPGYCGGEAALQAIIREVLQPTVQGRLKSGRPSALPDGMNKRTRYNLRHKMKAFTRDAVYLYQVYGW